MGAQNTRGDFEISPTPITQTPTGEDAAAKPSPPAPPSAPPATDNPAGIDFGELPASYGSGELYLIGRDPRWLFAYWDIDWEQFVPPSDPLYLRLFRSGAHPISETAIRKGDIHWLLPVPEAGEAYSAEIGYFSGSNQWSTLIRSGLVQTAAPTASTDSSATFASIPFHLTFERLLALIELAALEGESLVETISRLQREGGGLDFANGVAADWNEEQRKVLEALLGEEVLERFSLDSLEIERLLRRGIQENAAKGEVGGLFSRERWDHLLHLAAGNIDLAGS